MRVLSHSLAPADGENFKPGSRHIFYQKGAEICKTPIGFVKAELGFGDLAGKLLRLDMRKFEEIVVLRRDKRSTAFELSQDEQLLFKCEGQKLFMHRLKGNQVEGHTQIEEHKRNIKQLTMDQKKEFLYRWR